LSATVPWTTLIFFYGGKLSLSLRRMCDTMGIPT
jgi:hypothetical protein